MTEHILTLPERRLASRIAKLLLERLIIVLDNSEKTPKHSLDEEKYHLPKDGGNLLTSLGICDQLHIKHLGIEWSIKIKPKEIDDYLLSKSEITNEQFCELLSLFWRIFVGVNSIFKTTRKPFSVSDDNLKTAHLLSSLGFLEEKEKMFFWTQKSNHLMETNGYWDDGVSKSDKWQKQIQVKASDLYEDMPLLVKFKIKRTIKREGRFFAVREVIKHYYNKQWNIRTQNLDGSSSFQELGLQEASEIIKFLDT